MIPSGINGYETMEKISRLDELFDLEILLKCKPFKKDKIKEDTANMKPYPLILSPDGKVEEDERVTPTYWCV